MLLLQSNKKKTDILFNDAIYKTMYCADGKVQEVGELISRQVDISKEGLEFANKAVEEMRNCTDNDNSVLTKGACLGTVALKTEMKGAVYLTQSGISVSTKKLNFNFYHRLLMFKRCYCVYIRNPYQ